MASRNLKEAKGPVCDSDVKPVAKNKSGTVATNSGTSINAGNYKLVITGLQADGLAISGIEMQ